MNMDNLNLEKFFEVAEKVRYIERRKEHATDALMSVLRRILGNNEPGRISLCASGPF